MLVASDSAPAECEGTGACVQAPALSLQLLQPVVQGCVSVLAVVDCRHESALLQLLFLLLSLQAVPLQSRPRTIVTLSSTAHAARVISATHRRSPDLLICPVDRQSYFAVYIRDMLTGHWVALRLHD